LRRLRTSLQLAQEMGAGLGQCALLLGCVPKEAIGLDLPLKIALHQPAHIYPRAQAAG
jgi:hypothetical protein